jgi:MFS family permease
LNISTMLVEEKSTAIVLEYSNCDNWEHDPANPRRWSLTRKWLSMGTVTLYIFFMSLAAALMAPALPELAMKYDITDSSILAMTLSISFLSLGLFPLVIAPLSEMYGRKWVLHIGNVLLGVSNLACAYAPNAGSLIAFRFLGWHFT